jgi:hypothetical protein
MYAFIDKSLESKGNFCGKLVGKLSVEKKVLRINH